MASSAEFPLHLYELNRKLGEGSFGAVYLYRRKKKHSSGKTLPKTVAVKLITLTGHGDGVESLEKEFQFLSSLSHKNIVGFLGRKDSSQPGCPTMTVCLVMEACDLDLAKLLDIRKKFRAVEAAILIKQVLEGLEYLHGSGVIHRDMKPANVLIVADHSVRVDWKTVNVWNLHLKIADFGIAKLSEATSNTVPICMTVIGGTPGYWAPEMREAVLGNHPSVKSHFSLDSYSAGVMVYQLITGHIEADQMFYTDASAMRRKFGEENQDLLDFLKSTLSSNWRQRLNIHHLLDHPFIKSGDNYVMRQMREQMEQIQAQIQGMQVAHQNRASVAEAVPRANPGAVLSPREMIQSLGISEDKSPPSPVEKLETKQELTLPASHVERAKIALQKMSGSTDEEPKISKPLGARPRVPKTPTRKLCAQEQKQVNDQLWSASSSGDARGVLLAIKMGADKEHRRHDWTPLQIAANNNRAEAIKILLSHGTKVDSPNKSGMTPLYLAVYQGANGAASELLQGVARVDRATDDGTTPLMAAASLGDATSVKMLLRQIGDSDVDHARKALHLAEIGKKGDAVDALNKWIFSKLLSC